jgi:hypothetical protein
MNNIKFTFEIPEDIAIQLLEDKGYKITKYDFGSYEKEQHNELNWIPNIQKAVIIEGEYVTITEAFDKYWRYKINKYINSLLTIIKIKQNG